MTQKLPRESRVIHALLDVLSGYVVALGGLVAPTVIVRLDSAGHAAAAAITPRSAA